jgi:hypothetical protein
VWNWRRTAPGADRPPLGRIGSGKEIAFEGNTAHRSAWIMRRLLERAGRTAHGRCRHGDSNKCNDNTVAVSMTARTPPGARWCIGFGPCAELRRHQDPLTCLRRRKAVAVGVMEALTPDNVVATYTSTARRWHAASRQRMIILRDVASGLRHGTAARCICSTLRRAYSGNAIVGGGLPRRSGWSLADKLRGERV